MYASRLVLALLLVSLPASAGKRKKARNAKQLVPEVDLEQQCPASSTENFVLWRATASGPDMATALTAADAAARELALSSACEGFGALRCAVIRRNLRPWRQGYDPVTGASCATVQLRASWLESLDHDLKRFEREVQVLAADIAEHSNEAPVSLSAPRWASGCVAAELGSTLSGALYNALAEHDSVRLATNEASLSVRVTLSPTREGVLVSGVLAEAASGVETPLRGFSFPLDLLAVSPADRGRCRADQALGLEDGARLGAGELRAWILDPSSTGVLCEGERIAPRLFVNRRARVHAYSVGPDGTAYHFWPPPGVSPWVDDSVSLGEMHLVSLPEVGDERLLVVASPEGASEGAPEDLTGFCRMEGEFGPHLYPDGAAVGSLTFSVLPPGTEDCPAGVPAGPDVLAVLQQAPICEHR